MNENLPAVTQTQGLIDYDNPRMIATLKATVAKEATDEEFAMFAGLCKSTGLNPFKKEVWFIKTKGYTRKDGKVIEPRVQIMTGINGFLAVANSHPQFDGIECEVERDAQGQPVRAIAKAWRKDRKFPSVGEALWVEYYKPNPYGNKGVWEQMPSIMLAKCAKSLALREAFPQELNGLYTAEEMPGDFSAVVEPQQPAAPVALIPKKAARPATKPQADPKSYDWAAVKSLYEKLPKQDKAKAWHEATEKYGAVVDEAAMVVTTRSPHPDWTAFELGKEMEDDDLPDPRADDPMAEEVLRNIKQRGNSERIS